APTAVHERHGLGEDQGDPGHLAGQRQVHLGRGDAAIGGVTSLLQRHRTGIFLSVMAVLSWIGFATAPQGRLWNARLLPFWFLCIWLLAGLAVSEIAFFIATTIRMGRQPDPVS